VKFAAEALRNITDESVSKKLFFFNTFEFGPELNFSLKKFFILDKIFPKNLAQAKTREPISLPALITRIVRITQEELQIFRLVCVANDG